MLEREGEDVKLYDFPAESWDKQPDVVVLDATTPSIYSDIDCARIVKEEAESKVIMVGPGPHATTLPEETLRDADGAVDVICRGEYDYTVRDVVRCFEEGGRGFGHIVCG